MAAAVAQPLVSAKTVGDAFVRQYYNILYQSPENVHRFYQEASKLGRPDDNGKMSLTTTMQAIDEKIVSFHHSGVRVEIKSMDAQESLKDGVHVLVTGCLQGKDNNSQNFTQTFFLAPQENGYFVLNDMLRFTGDKFDNENYCPVAPASDVESPLVPEQVPSPVEEETHASQQSVVTVEASEEEVIDHVEQVSVDDKEIHVPEEADEAPEDCKLAAIPSSKAEDMPKKSYASIVKIMKENAKPFTSPAPVFRKPVLKSQEQVNFVQAPVTEAEKTVASSDTVENMNIAEGEADGCSVYVKGLPLNATPTLLEEEFKKFGPIRNGGIQVRSNKGFCFGFVEFEVASAAQQAIEASPIVIGGRQARVEEKKSTYSRGNNNRVRSLNGRGPGFRSEGTRGRGNYGSGRGYNRSEFNDRSEFGDRGGNRGGGFSSRGGDGHQSTSRPSNRDGGIVVNGTTKISAPRVSATA